MAVVSSKSYEKFCSFCFHSKRPESEFSNHWVKDKKDGTVCCPLLLANECGYCHVKGHTPKHCPRLASRAARRKAHAQRFANRPSQIHGAAEVQQQIRKKEEIAQRQKRERLACSDNQYAELMGGEERGAKRAKHCRTKPAPVWNGPKVAAARPLQGAWAPPTPATASASARNLNADEVDQLKVLLSKMGICDEVFASQMPAEEIAKALHAEEFFAGEQSLEATADGEAFFDNALDAEDAVMALAREEEIAPFAAEAAAAAAVVAQLPPPPLLVRQGGGGGRGFTNAVDEIVFPLPRRVPMRRQITTCSPGLDVAGNPPAIQLPDDCVIPDSCDLDADFGEAGNDGWGSD